MLSFMFGVLGSLVFWAVIIPLNFVAGSIMLKHIAPCSWETIKTGKLAMSREFTNLEADIGVMIMVIICIYLFWPFILIGIIFWSILKYIVLLIVPILQKLVVKSASIIPDIEIKKKQDEEP